MNKWAMYHKEREGFEYIENPYGFLLYKIVGEECFIRDMFIMPEFRQNGLGSKMVDALAASAKELGANHLSSNVYVDTNGANGSLLGQLKYGFEVVSAHNNCLVLRKEI